MEKMAEDFWLNIVDDLDLPSTHFSFNMVANTGLCEMSYNSRGVFFSILLKRQKESIDLARFRYYGD
jgi:hypothetical protein